MMETGDRIPEMMQGIMNIENCTLNADQGITNNEF